MRVRIELTLFFYFQIKKYNQKCLGEESNFRPLAFQAIALPLSYLDYFSYKFSNYFIYQYKISKLSIINLRNRILTSSALVILL